ncbi:MAG: 3-hydroxybutyrate dehydrogenase [Betaproteobacteria bacterium]
MLKGKLALVTGSTSGIGLGIAQSLARQGADLVLNGFGDPAEIERLRAELNNRYGVKVHYQAADLTKPAEIDSMMGRIADAFGAVDILVNNAGIQHVALIDKFPVDRWDAVIALNLSSAFHTTRCALPGMRARNWGRIINIASAHGLVASAEKAAYVAAKHGIVGLTKVTALETARTGITCNAICPGWVLTALVQKQIDARAAQNNISSEAARIALLGEKQPSLEFVTVEQLGEVAAFLCSPAADQVRGASWSVDGGWTAQ